MLIIIVNLILFISNFDYEVANASSAEKYEKQISDNNNTIAQYEEIKSQLHVTAELIRQSANFNTEFVSSLSQKWHDYNNVQIELKNNNEYITSEINRIKETRKKVLLGYYTITYYCTENYPHICNNGNSSTTATGTKPTPWRTIAVDPKNIPYGTTVKIGESETEYIAEDAGGGIKGNRIDICVATHSEALQKGLQTNVPVYIIQKGI